MKVLGPVPGPWTQAVSSSGIGRSSAHKIGPCTRFDLAYSAPAHSLDRGPRQLQIREEGNPGIDCSPTDEETIGPSLGIVFARNIDDEVDDTALDETCCAQVFFESLSDDRAGNVDLLQHRCGARGGEDPELELVMNRASFFAEGELPAHRTE